MGILLGDPSDEICDGTAGDHDGAVYSIIRLLSGGDFLLPTPQKDHIFLRKDSQKQPKAAHESPIIPLYDGYAETRGEAQAGAR